MTIDKADKSHMLHGTKQKEKPMAENKMAPVTDSSDFENLLDTNKFLHLKEIARTFAESKMIPAHFQKSPADCFVALHMAFRLNADPLMFLQKSYIVHGRPGIEAQLKIALANQRGPFRGPIQWDIQRDDKGHITSCTAWAVHKSTGERCEMTLTPETVKGEGWLDKQGSKWKTIPEKMYRYRSASWLIDTYCPEVALGLPTSDELYDNDQPIDVTPEPYVRSIAEKSKAKIDEVKAKAKAKETGPDDEKFELNGNEPEPEPKPWQPSKALKDKIKSLGLIPNDVVAQLRGSFGREGMEFHDEIEPVIQKALAADKKKFADWLHIRTEK